MIVSLTDLVLFRMAALHVILEEGGVNEGLVALLALEAKKKKKKCNVSF